MTGVFAKVLVPVELEAADEGRLALDRSVEVGDHEWVAVDETTVRALELAARLVRGGKLCIVHATHDFTTYATWMPPARIKELDSAAKSYATTVLRSIAQKHCAGARLHFLVQPGKPLDVILAAARDHSVDAIVMAASARRPVSRALLGSTTDKVIRRSSCPVLVVPSSGL